MLVFICFLRAANGKRGRFLDEIVMNLGAAWPGRFFVQLGVCCAFDGLLKTLDPVQQASRPPSAWGGETVLSCCLGLAVTTGGVRCVFTSPRPPW